MEKSNYHLLVDPEIIRLDLEIRAAQSRRAQNSDRTPSSHQSPYSAASKPSQPDRASASTIANQTPPRPAKRMKMSNAEDPRLNGRIPPAAYQSPAPCPTNSLQTSVSNTLHGSGRPQQPGNPQGVGSSQHAPNMSSQVQVAPRVSGAFQPESRASGSMQLPSEPRRQPAASNQAGTSSTGGGSLYAGGYGDQPDPRSGWPFDRPDLFRNPGGNMLPKGSHDGYGGGASQALHSSHRDLDAQQGPLIPHNGFEQGRQQHSAPVDQGYPQQGHQGRQQQGAPIQAVKPSAKAQGKQPMVPYTAPINQGHQQQVHPGEHQQHSALVDAGNQPVQPENQPRRAPGNENRSRAAIASHSRSGHPPPQETFSQAEINAYYSQPPPRAGIPWNTVEPGWDRQNHRNHRFLQTPYPNPSGNKMCHYDGCGYGPFRDQFDFQSHVDGHDFEFTCKQDRCQSNLGIFPDQKVLDKHAKESHRVNPKKPKAKQVWCMFQSPGCGMDFLSWAELDKHIAHRHPGYVQQDSGHEQPRQ